MTYQVYLIPLNDEIQHPSTLVPLDHRHLDFAPPDARRFLLGNSTDAIFTLLLLLLATARRSQCAPFKVLHPSSVPVVVQAHDEQMREGREECDEDERVE